MVSKEFVCLYDKKFVPNYLRTGKTVLLEDILNIQNIGKYYSKG